MPTELLGHAGEWCGLVGHVWQHRDHVQLGTAAEGVGEGRGDLGRPQVLVLDVDESFGPLECLRVAPGDAALAAARERVVAPVAEVRVRAQQLHDVRAAGHRFRGRCLPRERIWRQVVAGQSVAEPSPGAPTQRRGIRPPFPEDRLHVVDGRPLDGGLHVVPGRVLTVGVGHRQRLGIPQVTCVVATRMAQVDPADEGDVALRSTDVANHHQLLVMGAGGPDPHVQQGLRPGRLQLLAGLPVGTAGEGELVPVRSPDQAPDVDATTIGCAQELDDGRVRVVGELLIRISAPVGEQDQVPRPGLLDPLPQLGEVGGAVHQRADVVSRRPRPVVGVDVVQHGLLVCPFALGQQPGGHQPIRLRLGSCGENGSGWPGHEITVGRAPRRPTTRTEVMVSDHGRGRCGASRPAAARIRLQGDCHRRRSAGVSMSRR